MSRCIQLLDRNQQFGGGAIRFGLPCFDGTLDIFQFSSQGSQLSLLTGDQRRLYLQMGLGLAPLGGPKSALLVEFGGNPFPFLRGGFLCQAQVVFLSKDFFSLPFQIALFRGQSRLFGGAAHLPIALFPLEFVELGLEFRLALLALMFDFVQDASRLFALAQ